MPDADDIYEVTLSMDYQANSPEDAARQFYHNVPEADWYLDVKNTRTGETVTVDTETWKTE